MSVLFRSSPPFFAKATKGTSNLKGFYIRAVCIPYEGFFRVIELGILKEYLALFFGLMTLVSIHAGVDGYSR
jgi:hypothetical protein